MNEHALLFNGDFRDYITSDEIDKFVCGRELVVVTDPPFNIGYKYNEYNDKMGGVEYLGMLSKLINNRGAVIIHYPEQLHSISIKLGYAPARVVSWVYNSNTPRQHRDIAFYGIVPNFKQVIQPYKNLKDKRIQERISRGILGGKLYDWWNVNQVKNVSKEKTNHPCQMPLEVMKNIIGILPKDIVVIDPFMGSGTTGVACKHYGIDFIGIELNKEYYDISKKRIMEYEKESK